MLFLMNEKEISKVVLEGKILIYPTDTVYGLGCNALNKQSVERIKEIKGRDRDKPLSVIAPSLKWIKENLIVDVEFDKFLPGPYTVILKKKTPQFLGWVSSGDSLGVRIPDCEFTKTIQKSVVPFITTSVNLSGEKPAIDLSEIGEEIKSKVDLIIESKEKMSGKPSTLIINGKLVER